ncbi:MAG: hypothetical protein H6Q71_2957, partial [Firmicutes bacterium]|nr:hypothetical protein [Bacillota bacterium]
LRILGISPGFSAFGGLGPRPFVTFGAMPKVTPLSLYSSDWISDVRKSQGPR